MTDTNDVAKLVAELLDEVWNDGDLIAGPSDKERRAAAALTRIAAERDEAVRLRPKVLSMNCNAILLRAEAAERERDTLKERLAEALEALKRADAETERLRGELVACLVSSTL